jgi:hypothetical protein
LWSDIINSDCNVRFAPSVRPSVRFPARYIYSRRRGRCKRMLLGLDSSTEHVPLYHSQLDVPPKNVCYQPLPIVKGCRRRPPFFDSERGRPLTNFPCSELYLPRSRSIIVKSRAISPVSWWMPPTHIRRFTIRGSTDVERATDIAFLYIRTRYNSRVLIGSWTIGLEGGLVAFLQNQSVLAKDA